MRSISATALVLLCACSTIFQSESPLEAVHLTVEPRRVASGGSVELMLHNGSGVPVGYNLCSSRLERRTGGEWEFVPSERVCTMELRTLQPGDQAHFPLELRTPLTAGEYRYRTTVHHLEEDDQVEITSEPFMVTSGGR